jgi:hypothetical protein
MTKRRVILLLVCALVAAGIVYERGIADDLDDGCPSLCSLSCAGEGGCLLYRHVGCNCSWVCRSGTQGGTVCGGE